MDIEILREFVFLSKNLNFTETARRLNLSQSTLSNHMIKARKRPWGRTRRSLKDAAPDPRWEKFP